MSRLSTTDANATETETTRDGSRRDVLRLGALTAVTVLAAEACGTPLPEDPGTGGVGGSGAAGGSAGKASTTGGAAGQPMSTGGTTGGTGTGGTGVGGSTGGTTGGRAGGGAPGTGGTQAGTGGAPQGGAPAGGASGSGTGAGPAGGSPATGGAPPAGGMGGTMTGGAGTGGGPGMGWKEDNSAGCTVGTPPTFANAVANSKLPDPFKFINGMRITKKDDWECLRADLSAMAQACIYGPKMPPPDKLTATFSGGKLTVNLTVGSQTGSFSVTITGGGSAASPVPCLITCGGSSLPALSGVAKIDMNNGNMATESKTVGQGGLVNMLYGSKSAKSGSLIGWAWGLSRIIDGLELCPEAGINVKRIAVTGCSRNGKGALAMGAFDERVALTIPQEGGSGGPALWRVAAKEKSMGQNIQEATEIIGEANWEGQDFHQYAPSVDKLAADQHTVIALCAPRAVLVIDNDIDWLGPVATYGGGKAAQMLYEGLGIKDRCGVSTSATHNHCSFPSAQQTFLNNFVTRFLKDGTADTNVDDHHSSSTTSKLGTFDTATWIDWTIPTLTGTLPWDPFG